MCYSVSGSGKSSLIHHTLYPLLGFFTDQKTSFAHKVYWAWAFDKVIEIDQSPIGKTPRSNPATYVGFFNEIRQLFAQLPESKIHGYKLGRFSFNVKGGRCDICEGAGVKIIEMNYLPDVSVQCEACQGKRFNPDTLQVRSKVKVS